MIERQEIHCHNCNKYVQFDIDTELDGNHVLKCPVCGHEHCRVVNHGKITDGRWDQRNGGWGNGTTIPVSVTNITYSTTCTANNYIVYNTNTNISNSFLANSWLQTAAGT